MDINTKQLTFVLQNFLSVVISSGALHIPREFIRKLSERCFSY